VILQRYIIKETLLTLLAVLGVLVVIFSSSRFVRYLAEVTTGSIPGDIVFTLLGLKVIYHVSVILPLAFFLAVLLTMGRLYRDNEITALAACGCGPMHMIRSLLWLAPVVVALVAWLSLYGSPLAENYNHQIRNKAKQASELSSLIAGQFKESQHGDMVFYVEELSDDGTRMQNAFVQRRIQGRLSVLSSEYGRRVTDPESGDRFMVMEDGYRYDGSPGDADYRIVKFKKHAVRIEEQGEVKKVQSLEAIPTSELIGKVDGRLRSELQWRISMPLSALLLAMLAVPLSKANPREGRYARLFAAILIYIAYNNLMGVARDLVKHNTIWPPLGMWWVHILLLVFIIALLMYQLGPRWCLKSLTGQLHARRTA
jgi:lipopolysaccharide export system permease protein